MRALFLLGGDNCVSVSVLAGAIQVLVWFMLPLPFIVDWWRLHAPAAWLAMQLP
jgi:hypothetical protein